MRDYSKKYSRVYGQKQKVSARQPDGSSSQDRLRKVACYVITTIVMLGVAASLWFGKMINEGLNELSKSTSINRSLGSVNSQLIVERAELIMEERIEQEATKLGLVKSIPEEIKTL